jgi:quercetin dioxygenase-like cupin family protein
MSDTLQFVARNDKLKLIGHLKLEATGSLMVCRLRFAPHIVTPAHEHPHEQITLVERGLVLFTIGNEQRVAQAGDVLHIPSGTWHGATMLDEEVILVDIFSPIREDFLA